MNANNLRRKLQNAALKSAAVNASRTQSKHDKREAFIADVYKRGGKGFVERVQLFATTERQSSVRLPPWYREYLLAIGDFRLNRVLTTGPAQCGKTLAHAMLFVDALTTGKLNGVWFYDTRTSLDQNVPMQFQPVADSWIANMTAAGHKFNRRSDRCINTRFQIDQVNGIFAYVSTSRPGQREKGTAAAGGMAVSYQADYAFLEERSQYRPGSADSIPRRLDASLLPTRPIRELGTPGGGTGIEEQMGKVDHLFYPHYTCTSCKQTLPLDPKGCLLRETLQRDPLGRIKKTYLSDSGRPVSWFHRDENDAVASAYFACSNCAEAITDEQRYDARFCCRHTGVSLFEFLESLPPGIPEYTWTIGIHLSPLTRETQFNLASKMIEEGMSASTTDDWQQQMLGHPSEHQVGSISPEMLRASMASPVPQRQPELVLAGIDVGRSEDWLAIVEFYLPPNYHRMTRAEVIEKTIRYVSYASDVMRNDIPDLLTRFDVKAGLIDNEPSRESSMYLCRRTCLDMADQIAYLKDPVRKSQVADGGITYDCYQIRNEKFMGAVLEGFLLKAEDDYPLYRLPPTWEKWLSNPSERSPLRHLMGPSRDPKTQQWKRGPGNVDDFYFALVFAEAAFYIKLEELMPDKDDYFQGSSSFSSWW